MQFKKNLKFVISLKLASHKGHYAYPYNQCPTIQPPSNYCSTSDIVSPLPLLAKLGDLAPS